MRGLLVLLLLISVAHADKSAAKQHFDKATTHFAIGEFDQAAEEYQLAFKARPDPALLYNAAQAFRLANKLEKALLLYKNYVQLYPRERNVEEVRGQIAKLKDAIAVAESAKNAPPTSPVTPQPLPAEPQQPQPSPAPVAQPQVAHKTPIYKKWWLWTIVGVVVAGGVVTAAVVATTPSGTWNNLPEVGPGSINGLTVRW